MEAEFDEQYERVPSVGEYIAYDGEEYEVYKVSHLPHGQCPVVSALLVQ